MTDQAAFGRKRIAPAAAARRVAAPVPAPPTEADRNASLSALASVPLMTLALILGLCAIFVLQRACAFEVLPDGRLSPDSLVAQGADIRDLTLGAGEIWRIALAPLLHSSRSHLIGNAVALFLIGVSLEPLIGRGWYALIFAASALGGEIGSLIGIPHYMPGVGASGAITGLLGAGLVMSFSASDPAIARRMRNRALFFGVPAIAPLLWGAQGHTNYFAHFGGAVVGAALAYLIDLMWERGAVLPPFHRRAGLAAAGALLVSLSATGFAAASYQTRQEQAAQWAPLALLIGPFDELVKKAPELQRRFPSDPTTKLLTGVYDVEQGRLTAGETVLRAAMTAELPTRPWAAPFLHAQAQAILALTLQYENRAQEAQTYAKPLCGDPDVAQMLHKAKLCA